MKEVMTRLLTMEHRQGEVCFAERLAGERERTGEMRRGKKTRGRET